MWQKLSLTNFKSFKQVDVPIGPFTVIVGANASGKSNIRDAFRFLHGVGSDYSLTEIVGKKHGDGGSTVWSGIRGGIREIGFLRSSNFALKADLKIGTGSKFDSVNATYEIDVSRIVNGKDNLSMLDERLRIEDNIIYPREKKEFANRFEKKRPLLCSLYDDPTFSASDLSRIRHTRDLFGAVRFLDLNPDKMREPSTDGETVLGDQGQNLSSVLSAICESVSGKAALLEWVRELTPMDVIDFEFPEDQIGRILVTLIEPDGRKTSAYSASDGTLRFLAMAAALMSPEPAWLYFFEELDNGIHPTRLHLLLQLIEKAVKRGITQVIATTHSPELLGLLSEESLEAALLVYRLAGKPDSRVKRIVDLPNARELIAKRSAGRLHATGWLENAVEFTEGGDE